ncbi:TPM domain-containing protein [Aureimonas sp. AU20]|uniref:TPM domain-containing protein n=1 Tax=Aureimonas sp. AU20 TaxID=1349819 RepID=UPI00072282F5|nr:hypothetical protein [Aureimonas sp. AU20]ALN71545.1 hypothetical protein M673_02400 [Aureimonas sp. AU20]
MALRFTPEDHARIAGAIAAAERETGGEIYAVFARASDDYRFVAATLALALSLLFGWVAALVAALSGLALPALLVETAQLAGAAILFLLLRSSHLTMLFVPPALARARAARMARAQFLAHNLHRTPERTGVLLFVSEAERYAEVIADEGIAAEVPQAEWDGIVAGLVEAAKGDRLVEGFEAAVGRSGALLAARFPPDPAGRNAIPDRLVEI